METCTNTYTLLHWQDHTEESVSGPALLKLRVSSEGEEGRNSEGKLSKKKERELSKQKGLKWERGEAEGENLQIYRSSYACCS